MPYVSLANLAKVSYELDKLPVDFAFAGGAIIQLLLDYPDAISIRPTDDVDAIVSVVTMVEFANLENQLRLLNFKNDISEGAPTCRWLFHGIKVDILPAKDPIGTMTSQWFEYALQTATRKTRQSVTVPTISATCFLATKLDAFKDRGNNDYYGSHDLEDMLAVIDGRESLVEELSQEEDAMRLYVCTGIANLMSKQKFRDALPGHLPSDPANQKRLPQLVNKLEKISQLIKG